MRPRVDPVTQRELALALRYHIDQAQTRGIQHVDEIKRLLAQNPNAFASRHVQHNLGKQRLDWLVQQGLVLPHEVAAD